MNVIEIDILKDGKITNHWSRNDFDIHHKQWELKNLSVSINDILYAAGKYNVNILPDKIQYSEKLDVILWGKENA